MSRVQAYLSLILLALVSVSCSRPASVESFVFDDGSGCYEFEVDMTDSLSTYDLAFYTRLENRFSPSGFPMKIYLTSPSGVTYSESVYFDLSGSYTVPYRTDLVPVEHGVWKLSARARAAGLNGMGLICTRKDGTR